MQLINKTFFLLLLFFLLQSAVFHDSFCVDESNENYAYIDAQPWRIRYDFNQKTFKKEFHEEKLSQSARGLKLFIVPFCNIYGIDPKNGYDYPVAIYVVLKNISNKPIVIKNPKISLYEHKNHNEDVSRYIFLFSRNNNLFKQIYPKPHGSHGINLKYGSSVTVIQPGEALTHILNLKTILNNSYQDYFNYPSPSNYKIKVIYKNKTPSATTLEKQYKNVWVGHLESNIITFKTILPPKRK